MVHYYQAVGAAIVWLVLNACYVFFDILVMHTRILKGEQWRWYLEDIGLPLAATLVVTGLAWWLFPVDMPKYLSIMYLGAVLLGSYLITAVATPQTRVLLMRYMPILNMRLSENKYKL
jgi:hypothetical protein